MVEVLELVRDPAPVQDAVALVRLYQLMRRGKFDLVHTHTSKAGILGRLAARVAGVPYIVHTPHGHVFSGYAGRIATSGFVLLERWAANLADRIVGLTDQEIREHLDRKIGRREQFVSIPSGVEIDRFSREPVASQRHAVRRTLGLPASACIIGSVGRLEPIKGHRVLLDAFLSLAPRFPDLYLTLAGDGQLLPELRQEAARSDVASRVRFLGWRDDLPAVLRAFDVFAFPSLNEGMGIALLEAMAAGLPIVASSVGGIPEVLGRGEAGLLVEAGSAAALAEGLERLLLDPALRARASNAAKERARRYSVEAMLTRIEILYRELLSGPGR